MLDPVTLDTPRLVLRVLDVGDADALYAMHADPVAMRYWSAAPWTDRDEPARYLQRDRGLREVGSALRLGVVVKEEGVVVGTCTLFNIQADNRRAEIGYILARTHWGRGLMVEALGALVAHGFTALDLNRIEADADPRNEASTRTLERLGFVREGYLRERWIVNGEVSDTALYGLLRTDWERAGRLSP